MRACTYRDTHTQIQVKWKLSIRLVGYLNVSILAVVLYYKFSTIAPTLLVNAGWYNFGNYYSGFLQR